MLFNSSWDVNCLGINSAQEGYYMENVELKK